MSGVGCGFSLRPRWEAQPRSDHKFRVALSAKPLNRKLHPIPKVNSGTHEACEWIEEINVFLQADELPSEPEGDADVDINKFAVEQVKQILFKS